MEIPINPSVWTHFGSGALALGFWFGGLFFFNAYRRTKDRFFIFLTGSFAVMMIDRAVWGLFGKSWAESHETGLRTIVYAVRLVAFLIIAFGIVDKNMRFERLHKDNAGPQLRVISGKRRSA